MTYWKRHIHAMAVLVLAAAVAGAGCGVARGASRVSGDQLYRACASCHGPAGQGDAAVGAPRIAGLPAWYLSSQLERFQGGLRGKHPDDVEGLKMRAMSRQMLSKMEVDAVAAYVSAMPKATNAPTLSVDTAAGQAKFMICSTCHGPKGEGNQQLNAPPIAGLDDWYVARQLKKFQGGIRGSVKDDAVGAQMMGMAMAVPPNEIDSVAAYIHSLVP